MLAWCLQNGPDCFILDVKPRVECWVGVRRGRLATRVACRREACPASRVHKSSPVAPSPIYTLSLAVIMLAASWNKAVGVAGGGIAMPSTCVLVGLPSGSMPGPQGGEQW